MKMRLLFALGSAALLFLSVMIVPDGSDIGWRGVNRDGKVEGFKPDSEKYSQIVRYKVAETEVCAHPLFSGKNIYVKDKEHLTCWSLPEVPGRN